MKDLLHPPASPFALGADCPGTISSFFIVSTLLLWGTVGGNTAEKYWNHPLPLAGRSAAAPCDPGVCQKLGARLVNPGCLWKGCSVQNSSCGASAHEVCLGASLLSLREGSGKNACQTVTLRNCHGLFEYTLHNGPEVRTPECTGRTIKMGRMAETVA